MTFGKALLVGFITQAWCSRVQNVGYSDIYFRVLAYPAARGTLDHMSTVNEIEQAVQRLPPQELARFRDWFLQYDMEQWDCAMEEDVRAGRLDRLAEEALGDAQAGRCTDL